MALLSLMICKSSCVWDLLLYYFTELPQPMHGLLRSVGEPKGAPSFRSATQTGCWEAEAPSVHVGAETTDSSAEAVQGDPLSAREISSWWDFWTRGMVSCTGFISSPANHVSIAPLGWSWSLLGMLLGGWRVRRRERRRWRLRIWAVIAMRACKGERCLVEPS